MDKEQNKRARLNIDCSIEERRMARLLAAKEDKTVSKYLLDLMKKEFEKESFFSSEEVGSYCTDSNTVIQ